ncbi:MAG: carboxypeptidase-like regulatory domain-containing protein [Gemmatimonadota bacterium]|nr:MAG: carboxypeptidase-like regulatory domain-containing protein [Gemmatimonadota bacterium]
MNTDIPYRKTTMPRLDSAGLLLLVTLLLPAASHTQAVTGVVADVNNLERLVGAEILLFSMDSVLHAATFSGENGEFFIEASEAGAYTMEVRHLGYKGRAVTIALQTDIVVEVRVNLASEATELEGITVYGQTAETEGQREFLSRRHLPWNYSFDMEEIERLHAASVMDVVHLGVPVARANCYTVYLDGRPNVTGVGVNLGYLDIPIGSVYGVEVYRTYMDIPLKYRDNFVDPEMECGGLLIWSTVAPGAGLPSIWSLGGGGSVSLERWVAEVAWRRGVPGKYMTSVRLRAGQYDPEKLLGSANASEQGFESDTRPWYASGLMGVQGPAPWINKEAIYARASLGASVYGGQSEVVAVEDSSYRTVREDIAPFVGLGGEVAIGLRMPRGKVRPWIEVRTGTEYVTRTGFRWLVPVVTLGVELGRAGLVPTLQDDGN